MTEHTAPVRIGWGRKEITPPRPCMLQGQFYVRISEGVADPLYATACAVDGGTPDAQAVMVSCDLTGVSRKLQDLVRQKLAGKLAGLDLSRIFLNATHTHTAPVTGSHWYPPPPSGVMTPEECAEVVAEKAAQAVEEAWNRRSAGGVSWALSHAVVGHNRRVLYRDGTVKMYGKTDDPAFESMEGSEDHSVGLLCTWDAKGDLTGVVVNLACPSQLSEHEMKVSADFWCDIRAELRRRLGDVYVLPQCAPAGDQSPRYLVNRALEAEMCSRRGLTPRQEVGRRVAEAVVGAVPVAHRYISSETVVAHAVEQVALPVRMVTEKERDAAEAAIARIESDPKIDEKAKHGLVTWHRRILNRFEEQNSHPVLPVELHVIRIADVAIATNPFELFLDYGHRIRARSPAALTLCVQLAAGSEGYLPTERAVRGGGYGAEVMSNKVGPEGGRMLVERTLAHLAELWAATGG